MMLGHIGFSYIGLIFLLMLFVPNIIWMKKIPDGYSSKDESKVLQVFERAGEAATTACALLFTDFNLHGWSNWTWWFIAAAVFMVMYELWWIRYFCSERKLNDFYSSFLGIPVAGATLPVVAFFLLGIYGKVIWMLLSSVILAVGHVGIHYQHYKKIKTE